MARTQLVVMAAGIGSRYGGLKQIDPVGPSGEIVIDYSIYDALRSGFEKVVFIIRRDIEEAFREKVGRTIEPHIETHYVFQELENIPEGFSVPPGREKPWGTGHAVLCAADAIDGPFAVINADDFYGRGSFEALGNYLAGASDDGGVGDYSMVGFRIRNTVSEHGYVSRGVCTVSEDGCLTSIVERTRIETFGDAIRYSEDGGETWIDLPRESIVSMNMWGFTPSFLDELRNGFAEFLRNRGEEPKAEYYIPTAVNAALEAGRARVKVLPTEEKWLGVTYPEDKPAVQQAIGKLVEQGVYPPNLWAE